MKRFLPASASFKITSCVSYLKLKNVVSLFYLDGVLKRKKEKKRRKPNQIISNISPEWYRASFAQQFKALKSNFTIYKLSCLKLRRCETKSPSFCFSGKLREAESTLLHSSLERSIEWVAVEGVSIKLLGHMKGIMGRKKQRERHSLHFSFPSHLAFALPSFIFHGISRLLIIPPKI